MKQEFYANLASQFWQTLVVAKLLHLQKKLEREPRFTETYKGTIIDYIGQ